MSEWVSGQVKQVPSIGGESYGHARGADNQKLRAGRMGRREGCAGERHMWPSQRCE